MPMNCVLKGPFEYFRKNRICWKFKKQIGLFRKQNIRSFNIAGIYLEIHLCKDTVFSISFVFNIANSFIWNFTIMSYLHDDISMKLYVIVDTKSNTYLYVVDIYLVCLIAII